MDPEAIECELAERDPGLCVCKGGPTLELLKEVQRLYEEKIESIELSSGGINKMKLQVDILKMWVSDLVSQNTLLIRAVEELEQEATAKLIMERRKHNEVVSELTCERAALRRRLAQKESDVRGMVEVLRRLREYDVCTLDGIHFFEVTESDIFGRQSQEQGDLETPKPNLRRNTKHYNVNKYFNFSNKKNVCSKMSELKMLNDSLHIENITKDREIRQLNKDVQQYEQTIMNLRLELSQSKSNNTPRACEVDKKDAEVTAAMCCGGTECGDWEPMKDFSEMLHLETLKYQARIEKMETNLKDSGANVRALRKVNTSLSEELQAMRHVCAALGDQCRAADERTHFKDDIIREMRRQLKQAKAKLKDLSEPSVQCKEASGDAEPRPPAPYESVTIACVSTQPRRKRDAPPCDCSAYQRDGGGDDACHITLS